MKKIIAIIFTAAVFFGIAYNIISNEIEKREFAELERQRRDVALSEVQAMTQLYDAVDSWADELAQGEGFRTAPLLTFELERIWLGDRPILFLGEIMDISTLDESQYLVVVECNRRCTRRMRTVDDLRLNLRANRQRIDNLLMEHRVAFSKRYLRPELAIIADIEDIESTKHVDGEGFEYSIKTGNGVLLDLYFLDRIRL